MSGADNLSARLPAHTGVPSVIDRAALTASMAGTAAGAAGSKPKSKCRIMLAARGELVEWRAAGIKQRLLTPFPLPVNVYAKLNFVVDITITRSN